ncbi:MAG: hypothetical protein JNK49_11295 [Planctomycetes bacterium]|nr:hypothetical protein [Planctomycetota bacterium]
MPADQRLGVLFRCSGNSCRGQRAEGWAKALVADRIDACAAGARTDDEALPHHRAVRDQIRAFVATLPAGLHKLPSTGDRT